MGISRKLAQTFQRESFTINSGDTVDVDSVLYSSLLSKRYIIDLNIIAQDKYRSFEMLVSKKGTDVTDSIFSKIGDVININVSFVKVSTDAILRVTNNELVTITLNILKI